MKDKVLPGSRDPAVARKDGKRRLRSVLVTRVELKTSSSFLKAMGRPKGIYLFEKDAGEPA